VEQAGNWASGHRLASGGSCCTVAADAAEGAPGEDIEVGMVGYVEADVEATAAVVRWGFSVEGNDWRTEERSHFGSCELEVVCYPSCSELDLLELAGRTGKSSSVSDRGVVEHRKCWQRQHRAGPGRTDCCCHCSSHILCPAESRSLPSRPARRASCRCQGRPSPSSDASTSVCSSVPAGVGQKVIAKGMLLDVLKQEDTGGRGRS
jgi:hypothetical protein